MATDFFWSYTDEPHASRRRQILAQHPRIRDLFGPDPFAFLKIAVVVLLQLWTATLLCDASFTKLLLVAYFFGSILNHNLFLAMSSVLKNGRLGGLFLVPVSFYLIRRSGWPWAAPRRSGRRLGGLGRRLGGPGRCLNG